MADHRIRSNIMEPWWIRKAVYTVAAIIGLALTAFNIVEPATVDAWATQLTPLVSVLIAGVGGLAAMKTGENSDDTRPLVDADEITARVDEVAARLDALVPGASDRIAREVTNITGLPVYRGSSSAE